MDTTDNTAVENKNIFSSLFNSIQQPENRFAVGLTILLSAILGIIIHYGWQQPFDQDLFIFAVAVVVVVTFIALVAGNGAFAIIAVVTGAFGAAFANTVGIVIGLIGAIAFMGGRYIWKKNKRYYFPFLLILAITSAWLVFSNQLTETKAGEIDLEMYSKVNEKLVTKKSVFIPLFFSTLENEYFAVVKLTPRKIHVKVTIPDNPKAKWRGERKFEDSIYVDFQPLNHKAREKIMGSGLWQIETKTTSEVDMPEAIKVEIMKQLNLEPSDVTIKISEIWS